MSNAAGFIRIELGNDDTPASPSHEVDLKSESPLETPAKTAPLPAEQTGIRSVRVFDPQRQTGSSALYYSVESKRVSSNGSIRHDCIRRRFSDFVWLRQELQRSFPGCVIPPLPTKSVLGTMQSSFVEKRQRGLNLFMERITVHPRLRHCSSLDVFLSATNNDLEFAKKERPGQEAGLVPSGSGLMNFFSHKLQSVQEAFLGSNAHIPMSDADLKFQRTAETVSQALTLAHNCLNAYQGLASASKESAHWWTNLGLSLTVLSNHERKQDSKDASVFLNEVGLSADRTSVLISHHLEREYSGFKQPLRDLIDQLRSVEEALHARSTALSAYQQAIIDLEHKKSHVEQLQKRGISGEKLSESQDEVVRAEQIRNELLEMLQRVSQEIERDVSQFQAEKQTVLKRLAHAFVQIQVAHNQKVNAGPKRF